MGRIKWNKNYQTHYQVSCLAGPEAFEQISMKTFKRKRWTIAETRLTMLDAQRNLIGKTVVNVEYRNYQYFRWTFDDGSYQEWYAPCKGLTAFKSKNQKGK